MTVYIALLQGVNVGRYKRIAMSDLKQIVIDLDGNDPVTVANSGNVVFGYTGKLKPEPLRAALEKAISTHVGTEIPIILRDSSQVQSVIEANPYPEVSDPKCLHVDFLLNETSDALHDLNFGDDHLTAIGREIYLHAPKGMSGITYDAKTLNKRLGTHHTSRNWSTVTKLAKLAGELG